ncbi:glutamate--tRNA ligase [Candidatus Dependentiae bacterium]|nr:glutamate--tRNA ligase [Candidatus Dependentiae bacterium]
MKATTQAVRVRFAPSPTGHLHIGGLRSALFNWLFARHQGGAYLLRVEDTDLLRSTKEYLDSQLSSLAWAGIISDEPVVYQMSRVVEHLARAKQLMQDGKAYPCFCAPRDADEVVHNLEAGFGQKYDRTCRDKAYSEEDLRKPHCVRFRLPDNLEQVSFYDQIRGEIVTKGEYFDDFVIIRRDGSPIYNFCVVVDDIFMRITHIIRGEDHIPNTPKQVLLYQALEVVPPLFAHVPLILGKDGSKMSKRDAAVSVEEYRAQGFMPEALINYLVRLGWSHGDQEVFTEKELINFFTLDGVGKKGSIFDIKKLEWLNGVYLRQSSCERVLEAIRAMNENIAAALLATWGQVKYLALIKLYKERATTLVELANQILALAKQPIKLDLSLISKWRNERSLALLNDFAHAFSQADDLSHEKLLQIANAVCETQGEKLIHLAQMLRLALTSTIQSPGVFDLLGILGTKEGLLRINGLQQLL